MSVGLWQELPEDLLKIKFRAWDRLSCDLKSLVVELAKKQNFKCVFCNARRALVIEHDHDPEFGSGSKPTIYNVRGLACGRCNWHLMIYEKNDSGEYTGWDHVEPIISSREYEDYICKYSGRAAVLREDLRKATMEPANYWRRRLFLDKFDDWRQYGGSYPWYWGFSEIREKKRRVIRTPEQFINVLSACVKFVAGEVNNPDYEIPDSFLTLIAKIKPMLDELEPVCATGPQSRNDAPT